MVTLTIPLIYSSLNVNLYKVHNLPMLHPQYQIQVKYELEGAEPEPEETDIKLYMMSQCHLCMFEEPLYPIDKIDWCSYALFTNDLTKI